MDAVVQKYQKSASNLSQFNDLLVVLDKLCEDNRLEVEGTPLKLLDELNGI